MNTVQTLYYERFLEYVVTCYKDRFMQVKAGHCVKIIGLAKEELQKLYARLKNINDIMSVYILSDTEKGEEYVHASKLIELRNDPNRALLILVPVNSRTSAEDSYGDATFQTLNVVDLQEGFIAHLIKDIPSDKEVLWNTIFDLLRRTSITPQMMMEYLLLVDSNGYSDESWGRCLYVFNMIPDGDFVTREGSMQRYFTINKDRCSSVLGDFSISAADRISRLPLVPNSIQKDLLHFFMNETGIEVQSEIFERMYEDYPMLDFKNWGLVYDEKNEQEKIFACIDVIPGKDIEKELVKTETGTLEMFIRDRHKSKISFSIKTDPTPKDNPDIYSFEIVLVNKSDFSEVGVLKSLKVGSNTNAQRKSSANIVNGTYEDGEYMLRVRVLDENNVPLELESRFKTDQAQETWEERKKNDDTLNQEQFRQQYQLAYCYESEVFSITNSTEEDDIAEVEVDPGDNLRRKKVDCFMQAKMDFRMTRLRDKEVKTAEGLMYTGDDNGMAWQDGSLNNVLQFDFGVAFSYQIQLSRKLMEAESLLLNHADNIGSGFAVVGANQTESKLQSLRFQPLPANIEIESSLIDRRKALFKGIKESAKQVTGTSVDVSGLVATFDVSEHIGEIKQYVSEYSDWLRKKKESELTEQEAIALQNIDTIDLNVELPDGSYCGVKLITPLHPLRLAWLVNMYELYQDWEERTLANPKYKGSWYKKLDKLFMPEGLQMDIAPLILAESSMKDMYQYAGELTFGWGIYAKPSVNKSDTFASEFRQLKSYTASILNVAKERRKDSDVSLFQICRNIQQYAISHPYTDKIVINIFNAGDAFAFALSLVLLENGIGNQLSYEVRLFSNDTLIQSGEAFNELLNPESQVSEAAEMFSQAAPNRLFPKLRYSRNSITDFIQDYEKYPAHITFVVNPFPVKVELVRPDLLRRSFYLNGLLKRDVVSVEDNGFYAWNRYVSTKALTNPINEFANMTIALFDDMQNITGRVMSSTLSESVPAMRLVLQENEKMMLSFVHDVSDWVVTFDKNMGPEFYDLPCLGKEETPYLLDYVPGTDSMGVSSFLTTRPTSEVEGLMVPHFKEFGITIDSREAFLRLLEDVRTVSSSILMQSNTTQNKAFEVLGITLTKRVLEKKHLLDEAFIIPVDLHKELFEGLDSETKERADNLIVNIDTQKREIIFTVVEIKCRKHLTPPEEDELCDKIVKQIENTIFALKQHYENDADGLERLDKEIMTMELQSLLEFYVRRAKRYNQLDPVVAQEYLVALNRLNEGYSLRFKQIGIIYNFSQQDNQKKIYRNDAVIFSFGQHIIEEIVCNDDVSLETKRLETLDSDFVTVFEPSRKEFMLPDETISRRKEDVEEKEVDDKQKDNEHTIKDSGDSSPEEIIIPDDKDISVMYGCPITDFHSIADVSDTPSDKEAEPEEDESYEEPVCDVIIGKNDTDTPQYGILGKAISNKRTIGVNLNECNTISLFGVQGAGKSYTIGTVMEMTLRQFSKVNKLPAPMAGVIFHYSDNMDYAPEFTSMVFPNDEAGQLAKLKSEYGAEAGSVRDVVLLAPEAQVERRRSEYPNLEIHSIGFDSGELQVKDWMFLLGAIGNDSAYVKELKRIMKDCRHDMSLNNIRNGVDNSPFLSTSQRNLANQKLNFASEYILDGTKLGDLLRPGRLIIVDLRDEFIDKDEALGLFVVMMNIFSSVRGSDDNTFNKFIVFDEAHKYMNNRDLLDSITTAIREMRHYGVSIMIASQDPMSLPAEIIELSSMVIMHKFSSPAWVKHVQKAITPLQTLTASEMSSLGSGEAFLWANKSSDKGITQRPVKISIRPRVTKHGGDTITAVR